MAEYRGPTPNHGHGHDHYCLFLFPEADLFQAGSFTYLLPIRRGPMYSAYSELREWKLRRKRAQFMSASPLATPTKKAAASPLSHSVPDFSMAFRKENRKPPGGLPPPFGRQFGTPPPPMSSRTEQRRTGSASASTAEEKRGGGGGRIAGVRQSYSCLKELKQFSAMASSAINEEAKGGTKALKESFASSRRRTATWVGY